MQPYQHTSNFDRAGWIGWMIRADRGRLRLTGGDALEFLQGLVTNDVASLQVGESRDALYLTPQGRMITDMRVFRGKDEVLLSVPAELAAGLAVRLDFLIFTEDVQVADASQLIHEITLVGSTMAHTKDVFFEARVQAAVCAEINADGVHELDPAEAEAMRIEAGRARWGVDMNEETIPLEAGLLERAISQTKGCYVGQEVIVRVLHRGGGRVARRLMKIAFGPDFSEAPAPGTPITIDGAEVGKITSAARSRRLSRVVALGYVQRDHANPGTAVMVGSDAATLDSPAS
jgi:folate-binding protein YgfZ